MSMARVQRWRRGCRRARTIACANARPHKRGRKTARGCSMRALSLSEAWDETKAIITRDGRLFGSVALALVALPAVLQGIVAPRGVDRSSPWWIDLLMLVASL